MIIVVFIAHFIHIVGFVCCNNYFVRCVNLPYIALFLLLFVTRFLKFNVFNQINNLTHTNTHIYVYIYAYMCVCVCMQRNR